jgi:hypothetical protein
MRGEYLKELLPIDSYTLVNIDIPLAETSRIFRSFGWRFKLGPLIRNINRYVLSIIKQDFAYDLVWIDKGVFIQPDIVAKLKANSGKLVHFTPDPAFAYHRSRLFYESLPLYDVCVTTKSFEMDDYRTYGGTPLFCTQGYDPKVHKPYFDFNQKSGVVFIGHKEEEREFVIGKLVDAKVQVAIAGNHWKSFADRRKGKDNLVYLGTGIYGDEYARSISGAFMSIGFLSKWIPELHTTRTFEIPACGTALVTERNDEILSVFSDTDVIYYQDLNEAVDKVVYYLGNRDALREISVNGYRKVTMGGYSYRDLLEGIVKKIYN